MVTAEEGLADQIGLLASWPDIAAAMAEPTLWLSSCSGSSARCAYRAVVGGCVWPSSLPIVGNELPGSCHASS